MDYAVVELNRDVEGATPMKFRKSGKITDGQELVVIGHPSGLPTKIADGAFVRNNSSKAFFSASLDTYGGNSGSAVFNVNTGEIEGILVRGENDYVRNGSCTASNLCPMDGCRGEDVTRIMNVKEIMKL
jgi:V8-like Glu-specific endopeptidase